MSFKKTRKGGRGPTTYRRREGTARKDYKGVQIYFKKLIFVSIMGTQFSAGEKGKGE